eukprot:731038_1
MIRRCVRLQLRWGKRQSWMNKDGGYFTYRLSVTVSHCTDDKSLSLQTNTFCCSLANMTPSYVTMLVSFILFAIAHVGWSQDCSGMKSYVGISPTSQSILSGTINPSSQALFAPFVYSVPPTPLVTLNASKDDICNPNAILTSDISNNIVLLFTYVGDCSVQYKVTVAQQNNATAVLIANNMTDEVFNFVDDNDMNSVATYIPARGISFGVGHTLSNELDSGKDIYVEFGCFEDEYPEIVCLVDEEGAFYWLGGEYQKQQNMEINDHPVYQKEGYPGWIPDVYMYLHDAYGDTDWFWVIASDESNFGELVYDEDIYLKCNAGSTQNPALCPLWNEILDYGVNATFYNRPEIHINGTTCPASNMICVNSTRSYVLEGLDGTYVQYSAAAGLWFRELDECDHKIGIFTIYNERFYLYDPLAESTIIMCLYSTSQPDPSLCTEWNYLSDSIFVTKGRCIATTPCIATHTEQAPTLCMTTSDMQNSRFTGEFVKTNVTGPIFNSSEWIRTQPFQWNVTNAYIWYINELVGTMHATNWILTTSSMNDALSDDNNSFAVYGYCQGFAFGHPEDCRGWNYVDYYFIDYVYDESLILKRSNCTSRTIQCGDRISGSMDDDVDLQFYFELTKSNDVLFDSCESTSYNTHLKLYQYG